ncbi:ankyrin repeat-containing domain protein [Gloeopeniophorella convolvens]|nr:ankyrin repeat-containing domain protein [Gloeopeniophorella convolvens]
MLKRLDGLTKAEHYMATAQIQRGTGNVEREQRRQKRIQQEAQYRKWLSSPNSSTNQATASDARHGDTSMWLVRGQIYEAWKSSGTLLWITGKPGAGKTVICSTVIKDLQDSLRSSRSTAALAYFYCDFRDTTKQSYRAFLGSLLIDLSTQSDESEDILRRLYSKYKGGSQEAAADDPKPPEVDDLKRCLKEMLEIQSEATKYIIVDALDEMPNYGVSSSREKTLELMSWLVDLRLSGLRLCVTSRPEDDIGQVLESLASHQIALDEEKEHRKNITCLIRSIVETNRRMQRWSNTIKEEVISVLSEKADGMFRYASYQLDVLCEVPMSAIQSTLKSLPTTLYESYESTLERISKEKRVYAHRLFQCLSFSTRPLYVEELAEVLAVSLDEEVPTYHDDWRSNDAEGVVLSTCPGSFIQVINEDSDPDVDSDPDSKEAPRRIVQFAHFSVKEFLTSDQLANSKSEISRFHVLPESSHAVLAKACLAILLRPDPAASPSTGPDLETYATQSWDTHARFEDVPTSLLKAMKLLFDPTEPYFAAWARRREDTLWRPGTPLYFAALCGLPSIVEHILASGSHDIDAEGGYHRTAFFAALEAWSLAVIRLLLDHGADVNAKGVSGGALLAAVRNREFDIVLLLLDRGANIHASYSKYHKTALHVAVLGGKADMIQLLLDHGADVNATGGKYNDTALQTAVLDGDFDTTCLLLNRGADANALGGRYGRTALHVAVSSGELDMVQLLLDRGADANTAGGRGRTALEEAVLKGKLDMAQLLLDRGADVDAPGAGSFDDAVMRFLPPLLDTATNAPGGGALRTAVLSSKLDMVELLLDRGASINPMDYQYHSGTVLETAAVSGKLDMVRLLLDRGGDVNVPEGRALCSAMLSNKLDMVQLLLDRGADINGTFSWPWSDDSVALLKAASSCGLDMVQLLLDRGADINVQCGSHGNVLQVVAYNGKTDIVRLILDRGFDVNTRGGKFGTALIGASHHGNLDVVQLLLAHGADTSIRSEEYGTAMEAAQASEDWEMDEWTRTAIVELLSSAPQDATRVAPPNGGAGSSTQ